MLLIGSIGVIGVKPSRLVTLRLKPVRSSIHFVQDIGKLSRIEYLATRLTLNKLSVFLAGDNANLWMFAH